MPSPFQPTTGPVPLGSINVGAAGAAAAIGPLLAQLNLLMVDPFGIGSLKSAYVGQFKAQVNFSVAFSDPIAAMKRAIAASLMVVQGLQNALALGIPPISFNISASLGAAAALSAKIAGINALIDATLGVRLSGVNFLSQINAAIGAGPAVGYGWSGISMAALQAQVAGHAFAADGFLPFDTVSGVMLVTKDPGAFVGMQFLFVTV